jgi:hypothetical protein
MTHKQAPSMMQGPDSHAAALLDRLKQHGSIVAHTLEEERILAGIVAAGLAREEGNNYVYTGNSSEAPPEPRRLPAGSQGATVAADAAPIAESPGTPSTVPLVGPSSMHLNHTQRGIILAAVILFVAIGLFPPWQNSNHRQSEGYALIFSPPYLATVDLGRLFIQWFMLIVVAAAALLLTRGPEEESRFRSAARHTTLFVSQHSRKISSGLGLATLVVVGLCALAIYVVINRPDKFEAIQLRQGMSENEIIASLGDPDDNSTAPSSCSHASLARLNKV